MFGIGRTMPLSVICGASLKVTEFLTKIDWRIIESESLNKRTSGGCCVQETYKIVWRMEWRARVCVNEH